MFGEARDVSRRNTASRPLPFTFPYNLPGAAPYHPLPPVTTSYYPSLPLTTPHCPSLPLTAPYSGAVGHRFVLSSPKAVPRARLLQLLKGRYPAFKLADGGTPTTRTLSPALPLPLPVYPYPCPYPKS